MKPFTKILHPTDFSEGANAALERAVEMCQRASGALTLMHVYEMPVTYPNGFVFGPDMIQILEDTARVQMTRLHERVTQMVRELAGTGSVPEITTKIVMGAPYREVVKEAQEGHYDLIVMGTHGRTGLKHLFVGSVAERVVRMASCPVLTVRGEARER
jgi:nucleotide-binding universal stress UspA family protein